MTIEYDENYWRIRPFEEKYYWQALRFIEFCNLNSNDDDRNNYILDYGCGMGYFVHAFMYFGIPAIGVDISDYAIANGYGLSKTLIFGAQSNYPLFENSYGLVLCYDVLEHLELVEIEQMIHRLINVSKKWIICSICMLGDPNYEKDPTHKTKRSREWWIRQFTDQGVEHVPTPDNFYFAHQILIFKKPEGSS